MNRRDFLNPNRLANTAGQVWAAAQELVEPVEEIRPANYSFIRFTHQAMATDWELVLPFGTPEAMDRADQVFRRIDDLEDQLSVYRAHSEVSRLNLNAWKQWVQVEPNLFDLLDLAARVSEETERAFDITAGAMIRSWGFFRGPRRVPEPYERTRDLARTGMKHVELDRAASSVRFLREGLEINLGAIGKGYALDRAAADLCQEWGHTPALLHGGHSSVYAIGSEPGTDAGWLVSLGHPQEPGRSLGTLRLREQAMGTSAATFQYLEHHGRRLGHILDPRIGWPATGVLSATVVAPAAAQADALATAFFILGPKKAEAYCKEHADVGVVLFAEGASQPEVFGGLVDNFEPLKILPA
jgi:thiamine biosynthesis lipoprotein